MKALELTKAIFYMVNGKSITILEDQMKTRSNLSNGHFIVNWARGQLKENIHNAFYQLKSDVMRMLKKIYVRK